MLKTNDALFPIVEREQEYLKIYNNTIDKINEINNKFAQVSGKIDTNELNPLISEMNGFLKNLEKTTSLEEYLSFKILIQKIEELLQNTGEIIPPEIAEPSIIKALLKNINNKLSGELSFGINSQMITSITFNLFKNNTQVESKTLSGAVTNVNFDTMTPGTYYFKAKYTWNNRSKEIISNTVTIEDVILPPEPPVVGGEYPSLLPYSNLWAYTTINNGNYEVILNNTWGIIDSKLGVYVNDKLVDTIATEYTAVNKGSAKNIIPTSKYFNDGEIKFVYKVTYVRDETRNSKVSVYFKSTTGTIEIATPNGGVKNCIYPEWNPEIEYGAASNKIVFYQGAHFRQTGWASKGDAPKLNGDWSPWTKLSQTEEAAILCPNHHVMDSLGSKPNAHLEPMKVTEVVGLGTPMEKMHITYSAEWGKWGGRKYTPKITPWEKISHMQYAFIDVAPDYQGKFITDKDDISHLAKTAQDVKSGAGTYQVSPNIFDPGAAFSSYGGTNPYMTEFIEMGRKYPYVKPIASLGGWSRSGFFRDAASDDKRAYFVKRCIDFLREFNFVGLDIDWEFPCSRRDGDLIDNKNDLGTPRAADDEEILYTKLMQDLRKALDKAGEEDGKYYFLSCALVGGKNHIDKSGIRVWHPCCDFISYMTYDTHGAFDLITNHQSYLFQNPMEPSRQTNPNGYAMAISDLVAYVTSHYKVPKNKISVGSPFYSRGWSGVFKPASGWVNPATPGLYAATNIIPESNGVKGCAAPGTMDGGRGAGVLALYHLNTLIKGGDVRITSNENPHCGAVLVGRDFNYYYDSIAQVPYLYNEKAGIFYTYEDERSAGVKCDWVVDNDLAGIISWDIGMDDYGVDMLSSAALALYPSLNQEDHLLTSVIFEKFKTNSAKLNYLNRIARFEK